MARQFTRGRGRLGARRMTSWFDIVPVGTTMTATGGTIQQALTTAEKAKRPFTIIRTHLIVRVVSDQLAATETAIAAYGLCVVSDQSVAIGATAVPTPVTDAASDAWFVHQWLMAGFNFVTGAGFESDYGHQYIIDSKAMRKVSEDQDVIGVAEFSAAGDGVIVTSMGRLLIKEH